MRTEREWEGLPGWELVRVGLADLEKGVPSEAALLLLLAKPRMVALGVIERSPTLPLDQAPDYALYDLLEEKFGRDAHSRYNALIRQIVSFTRALEGQQSRAAARQEEPI